MEQVPGVFDGIVEADETYVGGIRPGTRGRGAKGKTPIVGIVKRQGGVRAVVVTDCKASTVMPLIRANLKIGTELMTDKFPSYHKAEKMGYKHETVDHGAKEYVRGKVHTNTIEGFWSQLKRSIDGTYHSVSPKHLQKYVDEFAWRYNLRASDVPLFPILLSRVGVSRR
jgi:transposase-like protein